MNTIKIKNITNCYYYLSGSGEEIRFSNQENVCKILDYLGRLIPSGAETLVNQEQLKEMLGLGNHLTLFISNDVLKGYVSDKLSALMIENTELVIFDDEYRYILTDKGVVRRQEGEEYKLPDSLEWEEKYDSSRPKDGRRYIRLKLKTP